MKHGVKERSPYALRDTYVEFPYFEPGTYFMYIKINWNGKAATKSFSVNCYGPEVIDFCDEMSEYYDQQACMTACGIKQR